MSLEKHVQSAEHFLSAVAAELERPMEPRRLARMLKSVFWVLRERLTVEESFDLIASYPLLIKALYVEGWKPSCKPRRLKSAEEFIDAVVKADKTSADADFGLSDEVNADSVRAVIRALKQQSSLGEVLDIGATLPPDLRDFLLSA